MTSPAEALVREIDRYAERQRGRKDFARWRALRISQEKHQTGGLRTLRLLFGERLPQMRMLDVGCGMGGYPVALRNAGLRCDGVEFNPDYVRIANLRGAIYGLSDVARQGRVEALPFPDAGYDLVHCHDVLEHCDDPAAGLREIRRVLAPGGIALVTFINRFAWIDPHYHVPGVNWLPRRIGAPLAHRLFRKDNSLHEDRQRLDEMHYLPFWTARRMVRDAGFSSVENVRRKKLEQLLAAHLPAVLRHPASALFAAAEYCCGQNYYWLLRT